MNPCERKYRGFVLWRAVPTHLESFYGDICNNNNYMIKSLEELSPSSYSPQQIFVIGGAEVYAQLLPRCTELYLSLVFQNVEGETFFPPFENSFELIDVPLRHEKFEVRHYRNLDI